MHALKPSMAAAGLCLGLALTGSPAAAQPPAGPYAGEQARAIKALSERDVAALLTGEGIGYAKAAELNGYPGPAHALELKAPLALRPDQEAATQALLDAHKRRARELGAALVEAERRLDALFAERKAAPDSVEQATRDVALLQARLRAEHLNTHLAQTALLDTQQAARYAVLRGYAPGTPGTAGRAEPAPAGHHRH
jgi:hypothetical protein